MKNRNTIFTITLLALSCFVVLPIAQAVTPAPDGGYTGENTAEGQYALLNLFSGTYNTAVGWYSLKTLLTGNYNTATGAAAMFSTTTGADNTASGLAALYSNTTGNVNTANGAFAIYNNVMGDGNTADGVNALFNNTGSYNIALGYTAGFNLTTGGNNIDIGNQGVAAESDTIRIGTQGTQAATYVAGITSVPLPNGIAVVVDNSTGQLGVTPSSKRFKKDIRNLDGASETILSLRPVTFHYKTDSKGTPQFGLVAEEVAAVNPDLVVRDNNGEIYSVRYEAVNAMLLNEFLKEHRKVEDQGAIIAKQQQQIEALVAGLQKVSTQLATDESLQLAGLR